MVCGGSIRHSHGEIFALRTHRSWYIVGFTVNIYSRGVLRMHSPIPEEKNMSRVWENPCPGFLIISASHEREALPLQQRQSSTMPATLFPGNCFRDFIPSSIWGGRGELVR
jgi:hypothetical protein